MKKLFKLAFAAGMMLWLPASVMAQTEVKLEVLDNTPGNLLDNLLAKGLAFDNDGNATVTSLVIGGSLDATDWETIGQCALLTKLDLGKVNCERIPKNTLAKNVNIESLVFPRISRFSIPSSIRPYLLRTKSILLTPARIISIHSVNPRTRSRILNYRTASHL